MRQQPAFWLEVRKEYVIDNYEKMLPYLRGYYYDAERETEDSEFNKTFLCLKEVVDDICCLVDKDKVYHPIALQWEETELKKNVGLVASYLLAAQKKGLTDDSALAALCNILLSVEKAPDASLLSDLIKVATCCAENKKVVVYGFNWDDIERIPQFSLSLFCQKTGKTVFKESPYEGYHYIEGKGLLTIDKGNINLLPMNKQDFDKGDLASQFRLPLNVNVLVHRTDKTNKTDFPELIDTCTDLVRGLDNVGPSIKKNLKYYESGDMLKVRVLAIKYGFVECESIDPDYEKVRGGVFIPYNLFNYYSDIFSISKDNFIDILQIGDVLRVRKQSIDHYPFIIDAQVFKEFNEDYIANANPQICDAIHLMEYAKGNGNRWLTDSGMQVNVLGRLTDELRQAVENRMPVRIQISDSKKDKSGNWVINGKYVMNEPPLFKGSYDNFISQTRHTFIDAFLDYYYESPEEQQSARKAENILPSTIPLLIHILYRYAQVANNSTTRYLCLFAARFMAAVVSDTLSKAFFRQQMRYEECLIHFALGDQTASTLSLRDDDTLPHLPLLSKEKNIVEQLSKFQDLNVERLQLSPGHEINADYLDEMISASNVLRGKLEPTELNRIKKSIAEYIGVSDVYHNITRNYTDYGEESDTLEFKTSVVFPPGNNMQADPSLQKWAILKAVCGFLNTVSGGEILIGVNDYGMAVGLKNDMEYLYAHRLIGNQTMDSFRLYIKTIIDNAFRDDHNVEGIDVTSTVIFYVIERNNEGEDLLRIRIHPYENGIVSFKEDFLPEGIARSYYRTSGATMKMDDKLMKLVKQRKGL